MNFTKNFVTTEKNRKKLKKVKKNWIVVSTSVLSIVGSGLLYLNNVDIVNADVNNSSTLTASTTDSKSASSSSQSTTSASSSSADIKTTSSSSQSTTSASSSSADIKTASSSSQSTTSASSSSADSKTASSSSQSTTSASSSSADSKTASSSSQSTMSTSSSSIDSKTASSSSQSTAGASSSSADSKSTANSSNSDSDLGAIMLRALNDDSSKIHNEMINSNPALVNPLNNQNFHYHNPQGHSNDVAGITPHYNQDGKVDYWEGYYLWEPTDAQFGNEWYHFKTTDFSTFQPYDESDPLSLNNVALPDPNITYNGERNVEVDKSVNNNPLPWDFIFSGSTFANNSKADGQSWYSVDQWGNKINPDARIACFPSAGAVSYLAYSNDGQQFHPMQDHAIFDATIVGQPAGSDFRDDYVVPINDGKQLAAYVASGYHQKVYVLTSNDGTNWSDSGDTIDISKLPQFADDTVESPHITTMNGTPIMFFGSQQTSDIAHSYVAYITGEFNDNGIFQTNANSHGGIVDTGVDSYGGNFTKLDDNHQISLAWLGNWTTFGQPHMGGFTLARVLNYSNDKMNSVPIEPGEIINEKFSNLSSNNSLNVDSANKASINFNQPATQFNLNLKRDDNDQFTIKFDNGNLQINRQNPVNNNTNQTINSVLTNKQLSNVQFYVDNISVEIYLPEEQKMYTFLSLNDISNKPYQLTGNVDSLVQNYQFDQSKSPSILNIDKIKNDYQNSKEKLNSFLSKLSSSDKEKFQQISLNSNDMIKKIDSIFSDVNTNLDNINQNSNDARSHAYIALVNNDLNLINTKLYQLNRQIDNSDDTNMSISSDSNAKKGWNENNDGSWSYYDNISGNKLTGSQLINGQHLYFDNDGIQVKGQIVSVNGDKMYFDPSSGELLVNSKITIDGINYDADNNGILSAVNNSATSNPSNSNSSSSSSLNSSSHSSSSASNSIVPTNTTITPVISTGGYVATTTDTISSSSSANSSAASSSATSSYSASSASSAASSANSSVPSSSATSSAKSSEPGNDNHKPNDGSITMAKAAMDKAKKAVKVAEKNKQQSHNKTHVNNYNKAVANYYQAEKAYLKVAKLYNRRYYYDFDQVTKHSKNVKLKKLAFVYDSKKFTKQNRIHKLKKGTKVKVNKIVRHGKTTRFNIGHDKFITGLKSFIHKLTK